MDSILSTLQGKALGIPVWVWGVVLIAVAAFYLHSRSTKAPSSTATPVSDAGTMPVASVSTFPGTPTGIDYNGQVYLPQGAQSPAATSTSPSPAPALSFHFGAPVGGWGAKYVWRLTNGGEQWFQKTFNSSWPSGSIHPASEPIPPGAPQFSWELAELPPGTDYTTYTSGGQVVNPR